MDVFVVAVPSNLNPRLRRRLALDLQDHAQAFHRDVEAGVSEDVLDPGPVVGNP